MQSENQALIEALKAQTVMIGELVKSNQQVIALLTDVVASMVDEDIEHSAAFYLDGSPVRTNGG